MISCLIRLRAAERRRQLSSPSAEVGVGPAQSRTSLRRNAPWKKSSPA